MIAAAHRTHRIDGSSPDCKVCHRPSQRAMRERWGCDAPTTAGIEVFTSSCPDCRGYDETCKTCRGTNAKRWERCPNSQTDAWASRIAETYENLAQGHGWPNGEPWGEQDNRDYLAVQVYAVEVSLIREAQREAADRLRGKANG